MTKEQLTLHGNRIMIAIEKGQVGLPADDFKKMQKAYLELEKIGVRFYISLSGGVISGFGGLFMLVSGPAVIGLFSIVLSGVFIAVMLGKKKNAKRYVELVTREYPKVAADFEKAA